MLDGIVEDVELVEGLESFDARITERGWAFDDEQSDEEFVIWFYPPSGGQAGEGMEPVTTVWMHEAENGEIVHVVFVGTDLDHQFGLDELFDHLDVIEAYRLGDPLPTFDTT